MIGDIAAHIARHARKVRERRPGRRSVRIMDKCLPILTETIRESFCGGDDSEAARRAYIIVRRGRPKDASAAPEKIEVGSLPRLPPPPPRREAPFRLPEELQALSTGALVERVEAQLSMFRAAEGHDPHDVAHVAILSEAQRQEEWREWLTTAKAWMKKFALWRARVIASRKFKRAMSEPHATVHLQIGRRRVRILPGGGDDRPRPTGGSASAWRAPYRMLAARAGARAASADPRSRLQLFQGRRWFRECNRAMEKEWTKELTAGSPELSGAEIARRVRARKVECKRLDPFFRDLGFSEAQRRIKAKAEARGEPRRAAPTVPSGERKGASGGDDGRGDEVDGGDGSHGTDLSHDDHDADDSTASEDVDGSDGSDGSDLSGGASGAGGAHGVHGAARAGRGKEEGQGEARGTQGRARNGKRNQRTLAPVDRAPRQRPRRSAPARAEAYERNVK